MTKRWRQLLKVNQELINKIEQIDPVFILEAIEDFGRTAVIDASLFAMSLARDKNIEARWRAILSMATQPGLPIFPLQGRDLCRVNVPAGPVIGQLLQQVRHWWYEQDCKPDQARCLAKALDLYYKNNFRPVT